MKTVKLQQFKYTLIDKPIDVTSMPLTNNLFGINNRIYANLGSYSMSVEHKAQLSKNFREDELQFPLLNRLFQLHLNYRDFEDDWHKKEAIDFKPLFELVKTDYQKWERSHMGFHDDGDKTEQELGVLLLPLGSDVLRDGCNYAAQQMELLKMENFILDFSNMHHLNNFLNLF